jgi:hypothetical protein
VETASSGPPPHPSRAGVDGRRTAHVVFRGATSAAVALAEGPALAARVDEATPVLFYGAPLTGAAIALGAHQRAATALDLDAARARGVAVVRRSTGGPAARAGDGLLYLAIGLRHASALLDCPRDRVLNRNVRGMLTGLSTGGALAHYFGREFVSVARRPAAQVTWGRRPDGRVLLEALVGVTRPYALVPGTGEDAGLVAYPAHPEPPLLGKAPVTLAEAWGRMPDPAEVFAAIVERGYARAHGLDLVRVDTPPRPAPEASANGTGPCGAAPSGGAEPHDADARDVHDDPALRWSAPRPVPIGFVQAALRRDAVGRVERAVLAGDFMQDAAAPARLEAALRGAPATPERLVAAINGTYGAGGVVIEGLRALAPVLEAFREVAS